MLGRIYRMRLATKHFIFLFLGGLLVFGVLAGSTLVQSEQLFRSQTIRDSEVIISRTNDYLDAYLENVQHVILQLASRTDILDNLDPAYTEKALQEYADRNNSIISTILLVKEDGTMLSNAPLYYDILGYGELPNVFELAEGNYGGINWSEPYWSPLSQHTVAFVRPVGSSQKSIIVIEINLKEFSSRLATLSSNDFQTFMILSAGGRLVVGNPYSKLLPYPSYPPELPGDLTAQLSGLPTGTSELAASNKQLIAIKSNMNRLGWSLVSVLDKGYFYGNIGELYATYGRAALLLVIILIVGALMISRTFSYPIITLAKKMDRVQDIDVPSYLSVSRGDEIGDLARSYNSLMARISILSKDIVEMEVKKRSYEIRMLQNQIGPHFLYNTLACIASLAYQNKNDQVQETINSLVGLLSITMGKESPLTTLAEEIQGIEMFTQIQNVRYGNRFTLKLEIDPSVAHVLMPRLTLQPLVENAIFHGIVPTRQHGIITIRAFRHRKGVRIYIRNNGVGINKRFFQKLLEGHSDDTDLNQADGLGVYNVNHRLFLYFGKPYGLRANGIHTGTVLSVHIPYTTKRDPL
ncbi:cache domain-containing sensor histidine kinase [Paenibacillus agricola]|uniref:Sensor histidine kinase n=1 Tax=Paenibacillus agricola TaxID=2716264 RepID=A0ABX0IZ96_9BACL|nr:sensor histidine kinase [Paenibacillus agricola]NHN28881.1 sensor histidine kinase [Paenibacillus agricola]